MSELTPIITVLRGTENHVRHLEHMHGGHASGSTAEEDRQRGEQDEHGWPDYPTATHQMLAALRISVAVEHLSILADVLSGTLPIFADLTQARVVLENSAWGWWLLEADTFDERMQRGWNERLHSEWQSIIAIDDPAWRDHKLQFMNNALQAAQNAGYEVSRTTVTLQDRKAPWLGAAPPTTTALVRDWLADVTFAWRLYSGTAHGIAWAAMHRLHAGDEDRAVARPRTVAEAASPAAVALYAFVKAMNVRVAYMGFDDDAWAVWRDQVGRTIRPYLPDPD